MTRTFIALEMNEELQRHLAEVIRQAGQLLPGLRWVNPTRIHVTLAFLGELTGQRLEEAIEASMETTQQFNPFSYKITNIGIFGPIRQPKVIWIGIDEPSGTLQQLHRVLNQQLEQRRFEVDTRPFKPHLTLARINMPLTQVQQQVLQQLLADDRRELVPSHNYLVEQIDVMKSELLRSGALYTRLREVRLKSQDG